MKKILFAALALLLVHSPIGAANSSVSISKSLTAVDSALTVTARGFNSVSYQLSGTWVGTVKFEGTVNSTTWKTVYAVNQTGGAVDSVATANGVYLLSGNGFLWIRARVSAYTSGTIAIQAITNEGSGVVSLLNQSSAGASSNVAVTSSTLPTGAATAANQTNASAKTMIVDGSANIIGSTSNALDVNIKSGASSGAVAQGSTTSGQTGGLTQAAVTTAAPSYTTGQTSPLSLDVSGGLRVATHPVTYATTGSGTATGALRVELPTNGTGTLASVGTITNALPAGSAIIGKVGIDQTTPGTTNGVQINAALPAGANAIGKLAANSGVNIGDIGTVSTITNTVPVAGNAASGATDAGNPVKVGGKYNSAPVTITDGQRADLQTDANGYLKVNVAAGGASGGTSSSFGSSFPATGTAVGFLNSAGTNMAAGNLDASGYLKVNVAAGGGAGGTSSSFGAALPATGTAAGWSDGTNMQSPRVFDADAGAGTQYVPGVSLRKAASGGSVEAGTSSDPLRTDPTGTTTQPVSLASAPLPTGAATEATLSAASGKLPATLGQKAMAASMSVALASDQSSIPAAATLQAGSAIVGKVGIDQTTPGTTNLVALAANQSVNVAQINGVTTLMGNGVTGTGSQRVTIASDNTPFSVNATSTGAAAQGASVSGAPVLQGLEGRSTVATAVTDGQAERAVGTVDGKQVFMPYAIQGARWSYAAASGGIVNTTGVTIKTAAGAGIRNCVTSVDIENGHATVSTEVVLRDGASGTVIKRWWTQAAGGGIAKTLPVPLCGTANTLLEVAAITTGSAVYVNAEGYSAAE